jgi:hypothetical protein
MEEKTQERKKNKLAILEYELKKKKEKCNRFVWMGAIISPTYNLFIFYFLFF